MKRVAAAILIMAAAPPARAQNVIEQWARVKTPPAPALQPVTAEPRTTALLLLDFVNQTCSNTRRPRCVASVPAVAGLLKSARASHLISSIAG